MFRDRAYKNKKMMDSLQRYIDILCTRTIQENNEIVQTKESVI